MIFILVGIAVVVFAILASMVQDVKEKLDEAIELLDGIIMRVGLPSTGTIREKDKERMIAEWKKKYQ